MSDQRNLVFLDTETTSLNRRSRLAWEIGYIVRDGETGNDQESSMFVTVDLRDADPMSLRIGGYFERHPSALGGKHMGDVVVTPEQAAAQIERATRSAILVGAVPDFDEQTLARLLYDHGLCPSWHYHLVDVETLAAGVLGMRPPWNFDKVLAAYGLTYDEADRHTALGDARMVRDLYDRIYADREDVTA